MSVVETAKPAGKIQLLRERLQPARFKLWLTRLRRNQTVQGAVVLFALLLIFFSTPLLRLGDSYYSAADLTQGRPITNIEPGYKPQNPLLYDSAVIMHPWLLFSKERLWSGHLPLWNPYNGSGVPHLANYQSAVFSPYSLPFYILSVRLALIASAFLKLFSLGFFTFLFLKQLKLSQAAALVGAVAFMFGGYQVFWLQWPLSSVSITLPACLYFAEKVFSWFTRPEPDQPVRPQPRYFWWLVGFGFSLAVGLVAGHPETFYACFWLVSAYILFRLVNVWQAGEYSRTALWKAFGLAVQFGLAGLWALGLASVQLWPFFEYLSISPAVGKNPLERTLSLSIPPDLWPLYFFPEIMGNPGGVFKANPTSMPPHNFSEAMGGYTGGLVMFMAIMAVWFSRDKFIIFFGGVAIVWLFFFFNILDARILLFSVPGMADLYHTRTYPVWIFSISCLAALFMQHLGTIKLRLPGLGGLLLGLAGAFFLLVNLTGAYRVVAGKYYFLVLGYASSFENYIPGHVSYISLSFGIGLVALIASLLTRPDWRRVRLGLSAIVLIAIFGQTGYLFKDFNPTIDKRFFYPVTPVMRQIQQSVGNKTLATFGPNNLIPDTQLIYKLYAPSTYDGIGTKYYNRLFSASFGGLPTEAIGMPKPSTKGLKLFGIEYLTIPPTELAKMPDYKAANFKELAKYPGYSFYRYRGSLPRYYTVNQALAASTDEKAWELLNAQSFDPAQQVVLYQPTINPLSQPQNPSPSQISEADPVDVVSEEVEKIQLKVTRNQPGYLVLIKSYYPGWKAKVNGVDKPVLRANYTFSSVELSAGENIVEYYYDPDSVRYGLLISLASLLGLPGLWWLRKLAKGRKLFIS